MIQRILTGLASAGVLALLSPAAGAAIINFDSLSFPGGGDYEYGWDGTPNAGFNVDGANFNHGGFSGFAYSKATDTTTPGYLNQYAAITGGGAGGSSTYAVGYDSATIQYGGLLDLTGTGASITNTTYAALSMEDGDFFAKQFGGASGNDPDWFEVTITGYAAGIATGSVVFALADFRFADNSLDYIVKDWTYVDFSPLGTVDEIRFSFDSSDKSGGFLNTPAYLAIDNVPVPEPTTALAAVAGLALAARRRRAR